MRFIILLVAGAYAAADCKTAAGAIADQASCQLSATDVAATACSTTNCAFGDANVARQWIDGVYDVEAEACRATPFVKADCDKCVALLNCETDWNVAAAAVTTTPAADATCKDALDGMTAMGASLPACVATAAWAVAPTCADPTGLAATINMGTKVYGATGTTCLKAGYDTCALSAACPAFIAEYGGKVTAPAAGSTTDSSTDSKASPAAMISAGIALVALLF